MHYTGHLAELPSLVKPLIVNQTAHTELFSTGVSGAAYPGDF